MNSSISDIVGSMSVLMDKLWIDPSSIHDQSIRAKEYPIVEQRKMSQEQKFYEIMRHLKYYEPNQNLLSALKENFTDESLIHEDDIFKAYLETKTLDTNNISRVLAKLISIEDITVMQSYAQLIQGNVVLTRSENRTYRFTIANPQEVIVENVLSPNIDEAVFIPIASILESPLPKQPILTLKPHPHERLPLRDPKRRLVASIEKVSGNIIHVKFGKLNLKHPQRYIVIFRSPRVLQRFMYRALELLEHNDAARRYLFPISSPAHAPSSSTGNILPKLKLFNETIASNPEQLQAVQQIVKGPNSLAPYIIFGPPGTGKTTIIVEAILQLRFHKPRSRILVTAGSNSACDTIATKLCEYLENNDRLKSFLSERSNHPILGAIDVKFEYQLKRIFSRYIVDKGLHSVQPLLLNNSNCVSGVYKRMERCELQKFGILISTLCTVGSLVTNDIGCCNFFSHIFIDEAAASTEPQTLIGILGVRRHDECHVILSGDHKQLGAVIKNNRAADLGLNQSLMERLLRMEIYGMDDNGNYDNTLQTRLRRNYRSHPEIVGLYNRLYYNSKLIAAAPPEATNWAANWALIPKPEFPIVFQATHGTTGRNNSSMSSYNSMEAQVIVWYVQNILIGELGAGVHVQQQDIGIVTPYTAQSKYISKILRKKGYPNVEVGSVENYQGREKPIIIASLVRSFTTMGFIRNPRRMNVMLSRAKSLLILIGNPVTLRHCADFKYIIDACKEQGNYRFKKKSGNQKISQ